jgi:ABC-type sugar transport system ATPase subunit
VGLEIPAMIELIIFHRPTRDVDVGAIVDIHQFINRRPTKASPWW